MNPSSVRGRAAGSQSRGRGILAAALVAAVSSLVPGHSWAQTEAQAQETPAAITMMQEREILLEFFKATGGPQWKHTKEWGTASDHCMWAGVDCMPVDEKGGRRMAVTSISRYDNGLTGTLPLSLLQLPHLKELHLQGNRITSVPEEIFARADANRLQLWLWGNPIPELLVRLSVRSDNPTGTCFPDQEIQFAAEFDAVTGRARFQALFCTDRRNQKAYCLAREGQAGLNLELVSRGLRRIEWKREDQRHNSPMGFSDHEEDFRATLTWGDGRSQKLWISGGHAPIDVLIGKRMIESLVWRGWTAAAQRVNCDTLRW
jgi:hypothetical protein